ncbi:UDP-glucose 4-epimerase isoform X2 [Folsomia candida]|uniref:UDP-glucose 4-epimerase isoform X2 n=1 Tax=Folsomia candida TaxID=158441 RepID=UPI000B8FED02|nr:UDP-glucose 4-epimerase isoform X2 [Folsomia candida]
MEGKTVFVTGGAGYIGSHCCVELLNAGFNVVAIDNFTNCVETADHKAPALTRVEKITGKPVTFYKADLLDGDRLKKIFTQHKIDWVIHFAALKAVGESMQLPLQYYKNNLIGTINLLEAMQAANCYQLVFSSSCCVYGDPEKLPIEEDHPTGNVTNVYGRTKYFIEEMLKDLSKSNPKWNIISLRYFNPVGAHPSGLIGEDPTKEIHNVMPFISAVALGKKPHVTIFGSDYDTPDGTGVRDYIHVMDLASGHVAALKKLDTTPDLRFQVYNIGIGRGISVLELVTAFESATGQKVPLAKGERRFGDVGTLICDSSRALAELEWRPKYDLPTMCEDFWRWQTMNPNGYKGSGDEVTNGVAATNGN